MMRRENALIKLQGCWNAVSGRRLALDQMAQAGVEEGMPPVAHVSGNDLDMSFSGLKTAALNLIHHASQKGEALDVPGLCADFSRAVSDTLVPRVAAALEATGYRSLAIAGGVAAIPGSGGISKRSAAGWGRRCMRLRCGSAEITAQ